MLLRKTPDDNPWLHVSPHAFTFAHNTHKGRADKKIRWTITTYNGEVIEERVTLFFWMLVIGVFTNSD